MPVIVKEIRLLGSNGKLQKWKLKRDFENDDIPKSNKAVATKIVLIR